MKCTDVYVLDPALALGRNCCVGLIFRQKCALFVMRQRNTEKTHTESLLQESRYARDKQTSEAEDSTIKI